MSPRSRGKQADQPSDPLAALGLQPGDQVRFRRRATERWNEGVLRRLEPDGSLGITDARGSARAIPIELVEVRSTGRRGAVTWEACTDRAARTEQLRLL